MALITGLTRRVPTVLQKNLKLYPNNIKESARFISRKECSEVLEPKCDEEILAKQKPCPEKEERLRLGEPYKQPGHNPSMWLWPECCQVPCRDRPIRMDELYYKTSDKRKRKYQQTWCACPTLKIKEVAVCCYDTYKFPPMEKRKRNTTVVKDSQNACALKPKMHMPCMKKIQKQSKCPRFNLKGCAPVRIPPRCVKTMKRDCVPEKTPYPSYSECIKCEIEPPGPVECKCLERPMMCLVWAEYRKRLKLVQPPKFE